MKIQITPGHYVVAVSGGVDSVALLHVLKGKYGIKLTVAHFDHGIRPDSVEDRKLVQALAKKYNLPFVYHEGKLGAGASEEQARKARYKFLNDVKKSAKARAIITAHHQDDVLETAVHNLLRGTGRKGLASLRSSDVIIRPLLNMSKQDIKNYAKRYRLSWREDSTNQDIRYRRNYIRHKIIPKLSKVQRQKLLKFINKAAKLNEEADKALINYLHQQPAANELDRYSFVALPHKVALELMAVWLREHGVREFDKKLLEHLVAKAKILSAGKLVDVNQNFIIEVSTDKLALAGRDR